MIRPRAIRTLADAAREFIRYAYLLNSQSRWEEIRARVINDTPAATNRITCYSTDWAEVGIPVRYVQGGVYGYGIINEVSEDAYVDISGAPLSTSSAIQYLEVGKPELVVQTHWQIPGSWAASTGTTVNQSVGAYRIRWRMPKARLVTFYATQDSGSGTPGVNLKLYTGVAAGRSVSNNEISAGVYGMTVPTGTWGQNSDVAISTSAYEVYYDDAIGIDCTVADATGSDLTVEAVFVLE